MPVTHDRVGLGSGPQVRQRPGQRWLRLAIAALPLIAIVAFLSACDFTGPTMTIEYKSLENKEIWNVYSLVWWLAVAVFVAVEAALFYTVFRFRRRPGQGLPKQVHGNNRLEVAWTIVPALLLVLIAIPTLQGIVSAAAPPPDDALRIKIIGHQFWWEAQYPVEGITTANYIHVPVGRTVEFEITSADVQHSFWVAKLGGKMDALPNRTNHLKYTALEADDFYGQCAELCGTAHAFMKFHVVAEEASAYDAWVAKQKQEAVKAVNANDPIGKGQQLVTAGACGGCHAIAGTTMVGKTAPNLTHFGSRATFAGAWIETNEANVKKWVHKPTDLKPGATMPAFPNYTDEELTNIAQYLLSLK